MCTSYCKLDRCKGNRQYTDIKRIKNNNKSPMIILGVAIPTPCPSVLDSGNNDTLLQQLVALISCKVRATDFGIGRLPPTFSTLFF